MFSLKDHPFKVSGLVYILGFLIYSLHLSKFGYQTFDLLQPRYLIVGLCFLSFMAITVTYCLIKVDLTYIANTFKPKNLFPWLLRILSLSYVIWLLLFDISPAEYYANTPIELILKSHGYLSILVVIFTLHDLMGMMTVGSGTKQKITRSIIRIISIPSILIFIFQASQEPDLKSIIIFNMFIVFGLIGVSFSQFDRKHGIDPPYLDENTDEKTQKTMTIVFGLIAIGLMAVMLCVNFAGTIYPRMPSYLGGPQLSQAEIHLQGKVVNSEILLINNNWVVLVDEKSKKANKIRLDLVDKIIYK